MQIEGRQRGLLRNAFGNARKRGEQRAQRLVDDNNDARAARGDHRHIADELDGIPKPLVGIEQDGLARDVPIAEPAGLAEIGVRHR
jgi:hypothetical protein